MRSAIALVVVFALLLLMCNNAMVSQADLVPGFRPPAIPLFVFDPYMNVWMRSNKLSDAWPTYWGGAVKAFVGMIRIDGSPYRFMGPQYEDNGTLPVEMQQKSVQVYPTRTVVDFEQNGVHLAMTILSPLLTDDYDILSRPLSYVIFNVWCVDGKPHSIQLYYDNTAEIAVNKVEEYVTWSRMTAQVPNNGGILQIMRIGTQSQNVLKLSGDNVGINWGYAYVAALQEPSLSQVMSGAWYSRYVFSTTGRLPSTDDTRMPRACSDNWPVLAVAWDLGTIQPNVAVQKMLMFAYDDIYSIDFFGNYMLPYWKRNGLQMTGLLSQSQLEFQTLFKRCIDFDQQLLNKLSSSGSDKYATLASLSYRQALAGMKLTWHDQKKMPWYFLKEISSDGDLSTVDVIFPASPILLYLNPELLILQLLPILAYGNNETYIPYNLEWSPHHLGTYPIGNIKPSQQENMPIEESANMLMMLAAASKYLIKRGISNPLQKYEIYPHYWQLLEIWANFLVKNLPDPGNELCTDDFLGPSPHNINLAAKGIIGLSAFSVLCKQVGLDDDAAKYGAIAQNYSNWWLKNGIDTDGSHYKLQFDKSNSWSQKYNILYDYLIFGSQGYTFPPSVMQKEIQYYLKFLSSFGIPLDSRGKLTKLDWSHWIAAMGNDQQFQMINNALYNFAHTTQDRNPLTDWYEVQNGRQLGFTARPVVGALFAKLLMKNN